MSTVRYKLDGNFMRKWSCKVYITMIPRILYSIVDGIEEEHYNSFFGKRL